MPAIVRFAIRYHHSDIRHSETLLAHEKKLIQVVNLANRVVVKGKYGKSGDCSTPQITDISTIDQLLLPLGLSMDDVSDLTSQMELASQKAGVFLNASG